jgi:hypothetical protein
MQGRTAPETRLPSFRGAALTIGRRASDSVSRSDEDGNRVEASEAAYSVGSVFAIRSRGNNVLGNTSQRGDEVNAC